MVGTCQNVPPTTSGAGTVYPSRALGFTPDYRKYNGQKYKENRIDITMVKSTRKTE
jgi:hypothetical protein